MDFEVGIVVIGFAGQQRFKLAPGNFGLEFAQLRFRLGNDALVLFGFAKLDQPNLIVEFLVERKVIV